MEEDGGGRWQRKHVSVAVSESVSVSSPCPLHLYLRLRLVYHICCVHVSAARLTFHHVSSLAQADGQGQVKMLADMARKLVNYASTCNRRRERGNED